MTELEIAGVMIGTFLLGWLWGLICAMLHIESELKKGGINIEL